MSIKEAERFEILNDFGYDDPMTDKGDQHVTMYQVLGGREGIATLVKRFYALMDELPQAKTIRAMHPEDLTESIHKLELFLVGWMGGPSLYMQKYGHPVTRGTYLSPSTRRPETRGCYVYEALEDRLRSDHRADRGCVRQPR